jgi:hypothetical protein
MNALFRREHPAAPCGIANYARQIILGPEADYLAEDDLF